MNDNIGNTSKFHIMGPHWTTDQRSGIRKFTRPIIQVSAYAGAGCNGGSANGKALLVGPDDRIIAEKNFTGPILLSVERMIEDWTNEEIEKIFKGEGF